MKAVVIFIIFIMGCVDTIKVEKDSDPLNIDTPLQEYTDKQLMITLSLNKSIKYVEIDTIDVVKLLELRTYDTLVFYFDSLKYLSINCGESVPNELFERIRNYPRIYLAGNPKYITDAVVNYGNVIGMGTDNVCAQTLKQMGWLQDKYEYKKFQFCF